MLLGNFRLQTIDDFHVEEDHEEQGKQESHGGRVNDKDDVRQTRLRQTRLQQRKNNNALNVGWIRCVQLGEDDDGQHQYKGEEPCEDEKNIRIDT